MSIKLATHLYRNRHGTFYFRLVIPRDLRSQSNQTEVRFSLHTEQRDKAIIRAFPLIAELPTLISDLRQMADDETVPSAERLKTLLEEKRDDIRAQERIEELEIALADALRKLGESVPRINAKRVVKATYDKGQLKGKRETEDKLGFLIAPGPDYKWHVSSQLDSRVPDHKVITDLAGKSLFLPKEPRMYPRQDVLEWRLQQLY
jgi:hypothetical protein